ncbi:asparagine synthase (glutamine-hydrolyzing) [Verrucomicrobiota bacterium]
MSGICGYNWNDESLITRMTDTMVHRGPDQHGTFCCNGVSLGHRRLSIIDLSDHGRQPMANEDGSIRLVFDGKIYNFQELRKDLSNKGHRFTSESDSEVVLHAYEEYGIEAIHKLSGMFAFAIWDEKMKSLFLVRDRIGIKPLYYFHNAGRFIFASEIKAILEDNSIARELNRQALYDYLGFEFVAAPETMFKNIKKLPAGHYLLVKDGTVEIKEYWDLNFRPGRSNFSYEEAVERVRDLLDDAVKKYLVSDLPLGLFLSGGLDSSALVAMTRRHVSGRIRTFTVAYADKTFSELKYAEQVARHFETENQVLMLDDIKPEYVEKALWHLDEPMTDLSAIPLFLMWNQAKEHVTVCFSGEGGDENFAGYDRLKASRLDHVYRLIPGPIRKHIIGKLVAALPDQPQKKGVINILKRFIEGSNLPPDGEHLRWQYFSNSTQDNLLFKAGFRNLISLDPFRRVREYVAKCGATDRINRELYLDIRLSMPDSAHMKSDKMSMASSMEIRLPLLDHVLVEFVASLPGNWKLRGLQTKHIFRSVLKGVLPDNIVNRGKQGYSLPVKHLLRNEMRQYMIDVLNQSSIVGENMNLDYVNQLIQEHVDMKHNHNHVLWGLINVAIWQDKFKVGS